MVVNILPKSKCNFKILSKWMVRWCHWHTEHRRNKGYRAKFSSPRRPGEQDSCISICNFHTIDSAYFLWCVKRSHLNLKCLASASDSYLISFCGSPWNPPVIWNLMISMSFSVSIHLKYHTSTKYESTGDIANIFCVWLFVILLLQNFTCQKTISLPNIQLFHHTFGSFVSKRHCRQSITSTYECFVNCFIQQIPNGQFTAYQNFFN